MSEDVIFQPASLSPFSFPYSVNVTARPDGEDVVGVVGLMMDLVLETEDEVE